MNHPILERLGRAFVAHRRRVDGDRAAGRRVLDRVVHQMPQRQMQVFLVAHHGRQIGRPVGHQRVTFLFDGVFQAFPDRFQHIIQQHRLAAERKTAVQPRRPRL